MVEVRSDGVVQLIYHMAKEFLLQKSQEIQELYYSPRLPPKAIIEVLRGPHHDLANLYLGYLSLAKFSMPLLAPKRRFKSAAIEDLRSAHPFLDYACSSWQYHVQHSEAIEELIPLVRNFLSMPVARLGSSRFSH